MKRLNILLSPLLVLALTVAPALAQQPVTEAPLRPQTLAELVARIDALFSQPRFAAARWGALIKTAEGGKVLYERDADKAFMPASNMKLYTTTAALDALGPDYRFRTSVYAARPVAKGGVLRGDLILYGRGDPNLSPRFVGEDPERYNELKPADRIAPIEQLAEQLRSRGVKRIVGNLIGDESYFAGDSAASGWAWDDLQFYYGAEVSALTVNDNSVSIKVGPGRRAGDKPVVSLQPATGYVTIVNNAVTVASGPRRIGMHRPLNSNTVEIFGTIPRGASADETEIAIHDPAQFAATLLKEALERRGIRVTGTARKIDAVGRLQRPLDESKLTELASVQSQPLAEILKVVNKQSQNLHTEMLLRQLGALRGENPGLDEYGRPRAAATLGNAVRRKFLEAAGVDVAPYSLRDGSGLARQNLVTPRGSARLLEFMLGHPAFPIFRDSLTVAGVDGTLKRRMRDTPAANNLRGKTGTLSAVNALSGYVTTRRGQLLIFSMVGNNYAGPGRDVTGVLDAIGALLADFDGELP
ncbi:MAG: D-alanyl-D-alanine carboxypeptidase/D-alanyl-D-alanine-endopeptidase [Blastocatellia bacterium]|nr:D-alanyl-D-alanine carboxypeptidase/D-alanyl-D-alanine-endopeptidase [Blastocatellia bacterium]